MTHLKLLTALTAFVLLTACGGATPTATGEPAQTIDCAANPFEASCIAEDIGAPMRLTACLADITTNPLCTGDAGIATVFCEENPFDTRPACTADTYLSLRVEDCITAGNAGIARCNTVFTASASNTCLTNPFTDACKADGAFATYADTARTNRVSFCGISGNETNALCTALTTCQANPFGATCGGAYFEPAKNSYCLDNPAEGSCVNAADWVGGFQNPPNTAASFTGRAKFHEFLQGTAVGLNPGNVRIFEGPPQVHPLNFTSLGGDKKNGVAWFYGGSGFLGDLLRAGVPATPRTRLYAGILSGTSLGAPLATADVSVSVPWEARIQWTYFTLAINRPTTPISEITNFELTVDFANSEISGFVNRAGAEHFLLKATFNDTGWFAGTITHGIFAGNDKDATPINATPGSLTGIIGKEGAVGAFISTEAHGFINASDMLFVQRAFVGGFIARPPTAAELTERAMVEEARLQKLREENIAKMKKAQMAQELLDSQVTYTDWVEVTRPDTARATPLANQFLTGADGLTTATGNSGSLNLNNAKPTGMDTTAFGGDSNDGFQVFTNGISGNEDPTNFYAGILTTTNLGAPLTELTAKGAWQGRLYAARDTVLADTNNAINTEVADFTPMVNFTMKTISATIPGVTNFGGVAIVADTVSYDFTAMWDERGVFQGTINRTVAGATEGDDDVVSAGLLRGIIGQEGAVGVFISNADADVTYAGGFVAESPAPRGTQAFWLSNARNSANTQFLTFRSASAGVATADDGSANLITGDATVLNALDGDGITVSPNYTVTLDDLNDVSNSEDIKSGFGLALALKGVTFGNYYIGLLSGTNVGAPFTDTNQPAAEWTGEVSLYGGASNNFRDIPITLAVTFDDTNGGSIGHATDTYTYFNGQRDADESDIQRLSINGKFDANGVIYGRTTYRYSSQGVNDEELSLSGLIGVNGAVAVFGGFSSGDSIAYVGGFVVTPPAN